MSIRVKLLQTFDGRPGQLFSGEILAKRFGVSRAAIWKQMQSLKLMGLPIEGTERQGYRLEAPFDNSLVNLKPHGWIIPHYFLNTPSTQTLAKAGAAAGLPEGHVWIAEVQTKGRGRLDRSWESSYGGLWFSLLLRPKMSAAQVPPLTLIAGLSLREAVAKVCGIQTKLKWPNDLLIRSGGGWKKCAGILTEMTGQMDRTEWVAIGVGLNVNNRISKVLSARAVSFYGLTNKVASRAAFLETFMQIFRKSYLQYQSDGFEPFRRAYWQHYFEPDQTVRLTTASGPVTGKVRGVDGSGAIMIESDTHPSDARRVASRRKIYAISEGEIVL